MKQANAFMADLLGANEIISPSILFSKRALNYFVICNCDILHGVCVRRMDSFRCWVGLYEIMSPTCAQILCDGNLSFKLTENWKLATFFSPRAPNLHSRSITTAVPHSSIIFNIRRGSLPTLVTHHTHNSISTRQHTQIISRVNHPQSSLASIHITRINQTSNPSGDVIGKLFPPPPRISNSHHRHGTFKVNEASWFKFNLLSSHTTHSHVGLNDSVCLFLLRVIKATEMWDE